MTTIVYRDGVLAADTRSTLADGKTIVPGEAVKIVKLDPTKGRALAIGAVGRTGFLHRFIQWGVDGFQGDSPLPSDETSLGIVVKSLASLLVYGKTAPDGVEWRAVPFQAFGSGTLAALGALWVGASAERAVEAACRVDSASGLPVLVVDLREGVRTTR